VSAETACTSAVIDRHYSFTGALTKRLPRRVKRHG
jgi:hypothetical protein